MAVESREQYCRELEAHLCRKNDGHLIRIVGPAFEHVMAWAERGVPLAIARAGIDRYFDRYYAKGPRRRPVRIEFCEADVLDAFDEWRRAVGLPFAATVGPSSGDSPEADGRSRRQSSLPAHLERVIARLTALRGAPDRALDETLDRISRQLDRRRADAHRLRGDGRHAFLEWLRTLDHELLTQARQACDGATLLAVEAEARAELAPYRGRLTEEAFGRSLQAAIDRLIRHRRGLPTIAFD